MLSDILLGISPSKSSSPMVEASISEELCLVLVLRSVLSSLVLRMLMIRRFSN